MSQFDDLMAAATPMFLTVFGDTITYTPAGGAAKNIKAAIETGVDQNLLEGNVDLQFNGKTIHISARNNTEGQVTVKVRGDADDGGGDTVLLPGSATVWYVMKILRTDAGFHDLLIVDNAGAIL